MKSGLVLEGGAVRGVYTAGALDYLLEKDVTVDYTVGVSAGSCNAVDFVSRQFGRTLQCFMPEKESRYMTPGAILKKHSIFDMDMVFDRYPREIYPFDFDTYFSSDMECEFVVTNCRTGKAEYKSEAKDKTRLMELCRASSSMPIVTPMVLVDGELYVDGGVADSIPVKRAVEKGCDKLIVILTRPKEYRKKPNPRSERLWRLYLRKYPELAKAMCRRYKVYNTQVEWVDRLEEEGRAFVLRPEVPVVSRVEQDHEKIMGFYRHGYITMMKRYDELCRFLEK